MRNPNEKGKGSRQTPSLLSIRYIPSVIVYLFYSFPITKNKQSRISFICKDTKKILKDYLNYFYDGNGLKKLFSQTHIERGFSNAPIRVKHLRKFFSQEWDRRGGQTSIKKLIMGHSIKNDVDLMHYNFQSEEDLKKIYDKIMS